MVYTPKGDSSWYWKKQHKVKDLFKDHPKDDYKVKEGYQWLLQEQARQIPREDGLEQNKCTKAFFYSMVNDV